MTPDDVTLKEYLELHIKKVEGEIESLRELYKQTTKLNQELSEQNTKLNKEINDQHFKLNQTAIDEAKNTMNIRLDGMNEWRGQSKDREATFATKDTIKVVEERVSKLELKSANQEGKASQSSVFVSLGIGGIGIILAIIGIIIKLVAK